MGQGGQRSVGKHIAVKAAIHVEEYRRGGGSIKNYKRNNITSLLSEEERRGENTPNLLLPI